MKPLILFAFLVSALSSNATEWRSVSATNDVGTLFFVDVDSIKDDGRHIAAWTKENRKSPKQVKLCIDPVKNCTGESDDMSLLVVI